MYSDHMVLFYRGLLSDAVAAALAIVHYAYAWVRTASGVNTSMVDVTLRPAPQGLPPTHHESRRPC